MAHKERSSEKKVFVHERYILLNEEKRNIVFIDNLGSGKIYSLSLFKSLLKQGIISKEIVTNGDVIHLQRGETK